MDLFLFRQEVQCEKDGSCVKFRGRNGEKNFKDDLCVKCFRQKFSQYFLTTNKNIGALRCVLILLWNCRTMFCQNPLLETMSRTLKVICKGFIGDTDVSRTQKPLMTKSQMKTMLLFSYIGDAVHFGFIPHCQRINQDYYLEMLKCFTYVRVQNTELFPKH